MLVVGCVGGGARHAAGATKEPLLLPSHGVYLGAYVDHGQPGWHRSEVTWFERLLGRKLAIDHRFYHWKQSFPGADEEWDVANRRIPLVTWEPWGAGLRSISAGVFDGWIRHEARLAVQFKQRFFLRFAHEMNGDWYPWAGAANGADTNAASTYVAAWRHVRRIFDQAGATNVAWVWCPNATSFPNQIWNDFRRYYPGDRYVDWVCVDSYDRGATDTRISFQQLVAPVYDAFASRKPIMVGETSTTETAPGEKASWIAAAAASLRNRFPGVRALIWFEAHKAHDWRIETSSSSLAAFRRVARMPYFSVRATATP